MRFAPPATYRARPHALVTPGTRSLHVQTAWGESWVEGRRDVESMLERLRGFAVYAHGSLSPFTRTTGAQSWVLSTWRGRETAITHTPSKLRITSLQGSVSEEPDPFAALSAALEWLASYGVPAASLTSMATRLLEVSLRGPVSIHFDPDVSRRAFFGGRQEVRLKGGPYGRRDKVSRYRSQKLLDIKGAYPSAMSARPMALTLREVSRETSLDETAAGLAHAVVFVPQDLPHAPLPVRVAPDAIQFQTGRLEGVWPWCELVAAQSIGCEVEVLESWAPRREMDLFAPWWVLARTGRDLPRGAGIAKAIAVRTWGPFAMTGDGRSEVHFADAAGERTFEVPRPARQMPHRWTCHIAAEVTARVRAQLLTEALYGLDASPVHTDTDGVIVRESARLPDHVWGDGFGQWRLKCHMHDLEVTGPQCYRYTDGCPDCIAKARYHYVASGMNEDAAARHFAHHGQVTSISYLAREDAVLPTCVSSDRQRIAELLAEARLYGRGFDE